MSAPTVQGQTPAFPYPHLISGLTVAQNTETEISPHAPRGKERPNRGNIKQQKQFEDLRVSLYLTFFFPQHGHHTGEEAEEAEAELHISISISNSDVLLLFEN